MAHSGRGGKRPGAGRPKGAKTAVEKLKPKTKIVRIPNTEAIGTRASQYPNCLKKPSTLLTGAG